MRERRIGRNVADELAATGRSYVVIDADTRSIERHLAHHPKTMFVHGDACDDDVVLKKHVALRAYSR